MVGDGLRRSKCARFRRREFDAEPLRQKCRRWTDDHADALAVCRPDLPRELNDRAAIWHGTAQSVTYLEDVGSAYFGTRVVAMAGDEQVGMGEAPGLQLAAQQLQHGRVAGDPGERIEAYRLSRPRRLSGCHDRRPA